jgi:predicted lactoylglutathione lyase
MAQQIHVSLPVHDLRRSMDCFARRAAARR